MSLRVAAVWVDVQVIIIAKPLMLLSTGADELLLMIGVIWGEGTEGEGWLESVEQLHL